MYFNKVLQWLFSVAFHRFTTVFECLCLICASCVKITCFLTDCAQVSSDGASQRMLCTNARVAETVKWTCTCAGNAKSVGWESARRWACWLNVSITGWPETLVCRDNRWSIRWRAEGLLAYFSAVHVHTLRCLFSRVRRVRHWLLWRALILHSDEACWIFLGDWMSQ